MPRNPHTLFRGNIPAYTLGALDADDLPRLQLILNPAPPAATSWWHIEL